MARNKTVTRKLREEAKKLKARLHVLKAKLDQYVHFGGSGGGSGGDASSASAKPYVGGGSGSGGSVGRNNVGNSETKRIPLADELRLTLEFATTAPTRGGHHG